MGTVFPVEDYKFLADFAESVKNKIVKALERLEQITARAQVGQPARQVANVLLHHCVSAKTAHLLRMLPPHITGDLANTVDKHVIQSFARINNVNVDELEHVGEVLSLPLSEGGMGLKRLSWMTEGAHVASWLQCAIRVEALIGVAVLHMRIWTEAALLCQHAVKLHANMVENEGVDAPKVAGTNWETLHLSHQTAEGDRAEDHGDPKGQMVCPGQRAPTTSCIVGFNEKPTHWSRNVGQSCTRLRKTTMLDQPHGRAVRIRTGFATCTSELHLQSLPKKPIKTLREEISAWADHAHACAKAARNTGHNHIRDWWAGVLMNC